MANAADSKPASRQRDHARSSRAAPVNSPPLAHGDVCKRTKRLDLQSSAHAGFAGSSPAVPVLVSVVAQKGRAPRRDRGGCGFDPRRPTSNSLRSRGRGVRRQLVKLDDDGSSPSGSASLSECSLADFRHSPRARDDVSSILTTPTFLCGRSSDGSERRPATPGARVRVPPSTLRFTDGRLAQKDQSRSLRTTRLRVRVPHRPSLRGGDVKGNMRVFQTRPGGSTPPPRVARV